MLKLNKELYSLKQAPKNCNKRIHEFMQHLGYYECLVQHRTYVKGLNQGNIRIICVHVDNLLVTESNLVEIEDFKLHMYNEFDMIDL